MLDLLRKRHAVVLLAIAAAVSTSGAAAKPMQVGSPALSSSRVATPALPSGRELTPQGAQVALGNLPTGAALTADGRFLWTVSAGFGSNDVRIVDTARQRVIQVLPLPGASGGIALDSTHRLAYVSGLPYSRWQPSRKTLPGAGGNVVHVYGWSASTGLAEPVRTIPVPPPFGAPILQTYPPINQRSTAPGTTSSWPQKLAVSPDGSRLLVPLNLADQAAVVDLGASDRVRYVPTGSYPFAAAIMPGGRVGLVTNEGEGTLSLLDLESGAKLADVTVGAPLSHPEGVVVDRAGVRAYVAVANSDQVAVVDLRDRRVERTIWVGRSAGLGTSPVALAISPDGSRLFVAESGADEVAVVRLPSPRTATGRDWTLVGRIPVADEPQAVVTGSAHGDRPAQLVWVAGNGLGVGANPDGVDPFATNPIDPIFWAFTPVAPTFDAFAGVAYVPALVTGRAGLMTVPSDEQVATLTPAASRQLRPAGTVATPAGTPLRADGPIKHVFFVVRENRTYDQLLGDVARGDGDPKLTLFGRNTTPNVHALVERFPLLDNVLADSDASIQGHSWTSSAVVPDYTERNWVQNYAGRGRPSDFGVYAVTWPENGFLFDQAERQHVSYFNYGEGMAGTIAVPDRNRSEAQLEAVQRKAANSDLGVGFGGCYASDMSIGTAPDGGEIFDASLPAGAPAGSYSHVDCFRKRFASQVAANAVPAFNYLSLTSDHTRGTQAGFPTPTAMVADSDLAVGELVDTISHSPVWKSSAIFVVEDDSQDGADHVNAHRIPALVISPYARRGAVVHTQYDLLSVLRSMELILGLKPLSLFDRLAVPMYDAFAPTAVNPEPVTAVPAKTDLLQRNTAASPDAKLSSTLPFEDTDSVPQWKLDAILWHAVHGRHSAPPPPGPGAEAGE